MQVKIYVFVKVEGYKYTNLDPALVLPTNTSKFFPSISTVVRRLLAFSTNVR